jgi:hypothetical protein
VQTREIVAEVAALSAKFEAALHPSLAVANERSGDGGGSVDRKHRVAAVGGCNDGWTWVGKMSTRTAEDENTGMQELAQAHNMLVMLVVLSTLVRIV